LYGSIPSTQSAYSNRQRGRMPSDDRDLVGERNDFEVGARTSDPQTVDKTVTPAQTGVSHFDTIPSAALELMIQVKIQIRRFLVKTIRGGFIHVNDDVTSGIENCDYRIEKVPQAHSFGLNCDLVPRANINPEIVRLFRIADSSVEDRRNAPVDRF